MKSVLLTIFPFLTFVYLFGGVQWQVVSSTPDKLLIDVRFEVENDDDLDPITFLIGLPNHELPELNISSFNKNKLSKKSNNQQNGIRWINQQMVKGLETATLEISPLVDEQHYYQQIYIDISFPKLQGKIDQPNETQILFLQHRILNWDIARKWFKIRIRKQSRVFDYPSGTWIKFHVTEDKIYSFTGQDLINLNTVFQQSDPRSYMLFTNSKLGRDWSSSIVSSITHRPIPENLVETALYTENEEDSVLISNNLFFFYGRGVNGFDVVGTNITHHQNIYFTENTYWLLIPDDQSLRGQRVSIANAPSSANLTLDYGIAYVHVETDIINPFDSGLSWSGPSFGRGASYTAVVTINDVKSSVNAEFKIGIQGSSTDFDYARNPRHIIEVYLNSRNISKASFNYSGLSKRSESFTVSGAELADGANILYLDNNSTSNFSLPHFDYATVNYGRELKANGGIFEFYAPIHSNSVRFSFSGSDNIIVWNITNVTHPLEMQLNQTENGFLMPVNLPVDTLARFISFTVPIIQPIEDMELVSGHSFTQLRNAESGVDHLIIGPDEFRSASELLAEHRRSSRFISLENIYNEFSGGNEDPTAIRSFIQWTQEEWSDPKPFCALLMGDADYDYRNITGESKIKVPTIVTSGYGNRAADDRLAAINGRIPELALGRFPARNVDEAENFVEKLIEYEANPKLGLWRQRITLVADDAARPEPESGGGIQDAKNHTTASDEIAEQITPRVEINKLYMIEYPEVSDASSYGVIKPDATEALFETVAEGTAIINYIGHGSAHQWAQEKLLVQDRGDIQMIRTDMKLPIWIAGTCSWGHFDNIGQESFTEELIRQKMDGAAAIITTTRAISIGSNEYYVKEIFRTLFPGQDISGDPVGVVLQSVKDGGSSGELFHLFGDPAMPLPIPTATVQITSVSPDTLRSLDTARVKGIQSISSSENGRGIIRLMDAEQEITRKYNIASQTEELSFTLPGPTLFKGHFSITGQEFNARLRIPKDISYSNIPAQCNVYVQLDLDPPVEALGLLRNIYLKGGDPVQDNHGPIISFETSGGRLLRDNDHLQQDEELYVRLSDPLGINMTGEVGHEIFITDVQNNISKNMSSRFIYDENSITTGVLPFSFNIYDESIELRIKAWDNANNPTETDILLQIMYDTKLQIINVLNFPNPYATSTQFAFELTAAASVTIDVYTLGGRRVVRLPEILFDKGYHYIDWDGRGEYGKRLANGVYLYRVRADDGEHSFTVIRKLAKFQ